MPIDSNPHNMWLMTSFRLTFTYVKYVLLLTVDLFCIKFLTMILLMSPENGQHDLYSYGTNPHFFGGILQ
jgi:hypothetical protein